MTISDRILTALKVIEHQPNRYRAAIIDEAQDLSLAALQLIRRLVNGEGQDRPDGLLIVGDGAQRIYTSCFTLRQAGLEVRGRSTLLERNYRNTAEILEAAMAVAGDREIDDLGDQRARRTTTESALPSGPRPRLVTALDTDDSSEYLATRISELVAGGMEMGDIAVLAPTNRAVWGLIAALKKKGIAAHELKTLDDLTGQRVKVGTYWRAKGLEFKAVLLTGVDRFPRPQRTNETDTAYEEQLDLQISALFVAMTRAREVLDLIVTGEPTAPIVAAAIAFEPYRYSPRGAT